MRPARRRGAADQDDLGRVASSTRSSSPTPRCPKENVLGGVNNGWAVAMTLLGYERGEAAATVPIRFRSRARPARGAGPGARRRPTIRSSASGWPGATRRSRSCGGSGCASLTQFLAGQHPGPGRGIFKLYWSEYHKRRHRARRRHPRRRRAGAERAPAGVVVPDRRRRARRTRRASWVDTFLNARAGTIYAGTSQIQRNILGEMVLGLPKEPRRRRRHVGRAAGGHGPELGAGLAGDARRSLPPPAPVADRARAGGAAWCPRGLVAPAAVPARCPTARYLALPDARRSTATPRPRARRRRTSSRTSRGAATWQDVAP